MEGIFGCITMGVALVIAVVVAILAVPIGYSIAQQTWAPTKSGAVSSGLLAGLLTFIVSFCILSWLLVGNVLAGPPSPFLTPSLNDVVGVWHLNELSQNNLQEKGYDVSNASLEFRHDGTYVITNCPISSGGVYSETGKWIIAKDIQNNWGIELYNENGEYHFFWFMENWTPYKISVLEPWDNSSRPIIIFERYMK